MERRVTLRDVVSAVSEFAHNEAEVVATVAHLVSSGQVRLEGSLGKPVRSRRNRDVAAPKRTTPRPSPH